MSGPAILVVAPMPAFPTSAGNRRRLLTTDPVGYVACCNAVGKVDTAARLPQIAAPTLVIAGALDQGTPVAMAQQLAEAIPGARLAVVENASHLGAIEQPAVYAALVTDFIDAL